jgi:hypothetical protein
MTIRHRLIQFEVAPDDLILFDAVVIETDAAGLNPRLAGLLIEVGIDALMPAARRGKPNGENRIISARYAKQCLRPGGGLSLRSGKPVGHRPDHRAGGSS